MPTPAQPLPLPVAPPLPYPTSIEQLIGELVATVACLVARRLDELRWSGQIRLSADTRQLGAALMADLVTLRQATAGELDFERVAKEHGARALQERCDGNVSQRTIDELVASVLEILGSIVRLRLN